MRLSRILTCCLLTGSTLLHADLSETIAKDALFQLDLGQFFGGPVATFKFHAPVQAGLKDLKVDYLEDGSGNPLYDNEGRFQPIDEGSRSFPIMSYELLSGQTYDHFYEVVPEDYVYESHEIRFQLLPHIAPVTVPNFVAYANAGAFTNTVIHRSEINVLQGGGWTFSEEGEFILDEVVPNPPIVLERTWENIKGTIAMARTNAEDSATSQFFINLADNTQGFGNNYAVFGLLLNAQNSQPVLDELQNVSVWNYGGAFAALPIFSGYIENIDTWVHFQSISISERNPGGTTYAWAFVDLDGDAGVANNEAFDITLIDGILSVTRTGTGRARLRLFGTSAGQTDSFEFDLVAYSPEGLAAFPGSDILEGGLIETPWFGRLDADSYPYLRHQEHGHQFAVKSSPDGAFQEAFQMYDFKLESWLYFTSTSYPFIFDYGLNSWIFYVEGTGNGPGGSRYFYNYSSGSWFKD